MPTRPLSGIARPSPALIDPDLLSRDAVAKLRAHPRFAEAVRTSAEGWVRLYHGNRLLNTVVNDRGRALIGFLCIYLHGTHTPSDPLSGLTVSRLKTICTEQKICSAGRAEAILMVMRLFHFLEAAPDAADRRVRRLIPTERLMASLRERWVVTFTALSMIAPVGAPVLDVIVREDFVSAFVHHLAEHFRAGVRVLDRSSELALFTDRNAGLMVLLSLMLAGEPGDTFPPTRPIPVSISALSRRFGVSRVHVRKLLRDAAAAGLLRPANEPERVVLSPQAADRTMDFFATAFLFVSHCAGQALNEIKPAD